MTWRSFVDFWVMRELGQEDAVLRNYDVLKFAGTKKDSVGLNLALRRIGIAAPAKETLNYIPEVMARLKAIGIDTTDFDKVRVRLVGWYTWDRIRKGDIQQWFLAEHIKRLRAS